MKVEDALRGVDRLGIDTAPVIYLIEAHARYAATMLAVVERLDSGEILGVTSVVTLGEVLVQPVACGDRVLQRRYRELLLHGAGLRLCPIDAASAERAAELRARYGMRLPDALQIAVALQEGCEAFLTNDRRLARVTELRVLLIDDLEP